MTGGALIIVGEDYGEGSSIMQERSHAFAMKSQIWLLDPRPNLPSHRAARSKHGFALSEASNTPVMLELRIRACHVHGRFVAKDNRRAGLHPGATRSTRRARDTARIVLPPASFVHEQEKIDAALAGGGAFIEEHGSTRSSTATCGDIGIILQGGMYNALLRALERLGLADVYGTRAVPLYVMNVTYPLVDDEVVRFCAGKRAVLVVEEGQPDFIEQALATILRHADLPDRAARQGLLPLAGEYTGAC